MTRIETDKLLRKPFSEVADYIHYSGARYLDSPNKKYYLTLSHFIEPHMGVDICMFNLINKQNEIIEKFEPLVALNRGDVHWSENSKLFSIPLMKTNLTNHNYFIYDVEEKKFATIPIASLWGLKSRLTDTFFEIEYCENQIPDKKENDNYPTKHFLKPDNYRVELNSLIWHSIDEITEFEHIYNSKQIIELRLIDKGFRVFKGEFPLTTERKVWDIEKFAEYGDKQSKIWMDEIKKVTNGNYYGLEKACKYIGLQTREYDK